MPKQDPNQQAERRQQILEAALDLFARQGFYATSTRQVAQAAGVAEGTIFNYFPTKKDLLIAAVSRGTEQYFEELEPSATATSLDQLRETFRSRLEIGLRNADRMRFILSELLINRDMRQPYFETVVLRLTGRVEQLLEQRIERGYFRPCNVPVVAGAMVGAVLIFLLAALLDEQGHLQRQSIEETSDELARLFFYGLQRQ